MEESSAIEHILTVTRCKVDLIDITCGEIHAARVELHSIDSEHLIKDALGMVCKPVPHGR